MPELQGNEQLHIAQLMGEMSEEQAMYFANVYRQRRRDETVTLIMALAGFLGVAGIHRFYLGQIGMGLLYFFTYGFCLLGTVIALPVPGRNRAVVSDTSARSVGRSDPCRACGWPGEGSLHPPSVSFRTHLIRTLRSGLHEP